MKVMTSSLAQLAQQRGIKHFLVSFSDLSGAVRAKLVPARAIADACADGAGFAGFATWLDMTPADPDVFAIPDENSLVQLPWKPEVAWVASDLWMNGEPLPQSPRQVLRNAIARAESLGFEFRTGVECEFFVLSPDTISLADSHDHQPKPCYDQQSLMRRYDLISEISHAMQDLGWNPYQVDHEDANGQFEMNWQYSTVMTTADRHTFFKYMVKTLAEKHGFRATFMPKPFSHLTGNGCHMHFSIWDTERNTNLFNDSGGELGLSNLAYSFLAGILRSASALCAFTNPSVNSYRRINAPPTTSGATWSPNTISYAGNNRTHMIRIPGPGRIELRLPDGAANPYLLPAAVLHAGLDGVQKKHEPGRRHDNNMYLSAEHPDAPPPLPDNLLESLRALKTSPELAESLGERFTNAYLKHKHEEWRRYSREVSAWELANTLDC